MTKRRPIPPMIKTQQMRPAASQTLFEPNQYSFMSRSRLIELLKERDLTVQRLADEKVTAQKRFNLLRRKLQKASRFHKSQEGDLPEVHASERGWIDMIDLVAETEEEVPGV